MKVRAGNKSVSLKRGLNVVDLPSSEVHPNDCHIFDPIDVRLVNRIISNKIRRSIKVLSDISYKVFLNDKEIEKPFEFVQQETEIFILTVKAKSPYIVHPSFIQPQMIETCSDSEIRFEIFRGIKVKGRVIPPIPNVLISLQVNESQDKLEATTNEKGEYKFGRYQEHSRFFLSFSKSGFEFSPLNEFDFTALELASINISVESEQQFNQSQILFSLSRSDGFRRNQKSFFISDLPSGSYFLKPILKEYKFTPPQVSIILKNGEVFSQVFSIERYQYGISGFVRRITGEFEPDIEIKTVRSNGEHQISLTDANGYFRIGGFDLNQTVFLFASTNNPDLKLTPIQTKIFMEKEVENVLLSSIKIQKYFDLVGNVLINHDFLEDIAVVLMNSKKNIVSRFEFLSKSSNVFHFLRISPDNYTVSVVDNRQHGNIACQKAHIDSSRSFWNIEIECEVKQKKKLDVQKSETLSIFIALISIVIWFSFFCFSSLQSFVLSLFSHHKTKVE